ncbi:helix-turn-helix domain-containing protein [Flagellimonas algicola]|uniref:Helix-turn-helix transcriptional regulator n=1 Tax=Flagellimonas algicola TaxID=2583815 RepID=A0ABY2WJS5_9FLAO|nr:AraC family transcriptional regulator [Allomuricauda algicola]TMU55091.1 helix-turn-helix transcriptional regulator [Allomuricauda algicola]
MTFYEKEIHRVGRIIYANRSQIDTVIRTRKYLDRNYEANVNLNLLARTHAVSKFHLLRLFKKYYGLTPAKYVTDKRIAMSKQHLENGMSATQTCFAVGFESLGSFSTLFKRKTGKTPFEYQKEQLSRSF